MLIQFLLIIVIVVFVLRLIFQLKQKEISLREFFAWMFIWLLAIGVIWYPQATVFLANRLGVGRGVDLVIYVSITVVFYLMFRLLMRIERIEKEITKVVRDMALKDESEK